MGACSDAGSSTLAALEAFGLEVRKLTWWTLNSLVFDFYRSARVFDAVSGGLMRIEM
jgi:hypothetical protein